MNVDLALSQQEFLSGKKISNIASRKQFAINTMLFFVSIYLIFSYITILRKYRYVIGGIRNAQKYGSAFQYSGVVLAMCVHYPFLANVIYYTTPQYPMAVYYALTSNKIRPIFNTHQEDYLQNMFSYALTFRRDTKMSPLRIVCNTFLKEDREDCFPKCSEYVGYDQTRNYVTNLASGISSIGIMGGMIGGPVGVAVGSLAGAVMGLFRANAAANKHKKECSNIRNHCYMPPGTTFKC